MTDNDIKPKLAALRSLEATLHLHRSAEAARAAHAGPRDTTSGPSAEPCAAWWRQGQAWAQRTAREWCPKLGAMCSQIRGLSIWSRLAAVPWHSVLCGPVVRKVGMWLTIVIGIFAVLIGALWWRLANGPISLDLATPWLTAAIAENFGSNYRVDVAGTVLERDEHGRTALRIRGIVVRASDGTVVASAPRAEVGFSTGSLLGGRPRAESINLVGAELALRIETDGTVTVFAGVDTRPIATSPVITTAGQPSRTATPPQDRAASASHPRLENFAALLSWIDSLGSVGLDGQDLTEVGLKNGVVVVDDLRNGVRSKFERINLSLTRPRAGELALRIGSDDPDRPWILGAEIRPTLQGARAVSLEARKVSLRDLLLVARVGEGQIAGDLPVSGSLRAEIGADGTPQFATGRMLFGPGAIGEHGDPTGLIAIDRAELNLEWDSVRRMFATPFQIVAGGTRLTLIAQAEAPRDPGGPWNIGLRGGTVLLASSASNEPGLLLNRIGMRGRLDPVKRRIDIEQVDLGGKDVGVAMSGSLDFSTADPRLAVGIAARNMSAAAFKQLWPAFVNPKVREWVLRNMSGGSVERLEIATNAPLSTLRANGPPIPDDGLSIQVVTSGTTVRAVENLPPIRDADLVTRVKGRNVTITLGRGVVELPSGRKLTLVNGVFEVPDTFPNNPPARARARIESAVPAVAELLATDRLREASGAPLDPATSRGTISAQVSLALPLASDLPKGAVNYNIAADVTNFAVDKFVLSQRIEAQILRVTANAQGYTLKGDVRIGGTPANIEYRKAAGEEEAEIRLQATFDDAARGRLGIDLYGAVTGSVPLKLAGRLAGSSEQESRFAIEADLTPAKVDGLLPGWIKPPGKPARATFNYVGKGKAARFDDLVIEGSGASVKGAVELDTNGELINATFPMFGFAESDKASLKAERTPEGVLKVVMRGDVYDGRSFIKATMGGTKPDAKERKSIADLELDVKIGALAGFNGEALRGLDLRLARREGRIRNFSLNAKLGIDTPLIGDLRGRQNRTVVYFETADAGALFRFTDTYARMVGGSMWMAMDPPTIDHAPQEGLLNVRDFTVRGEPALDRVAGGGGPGQQSSVEFSRMRVEFVRSSGRLTIREGLVRGPAVGATIDGHIDYAGNEVRMRGTFVPLYGLNNALNQIPIVGLFLGGSNEGLVGITYEVVGTPGTPVLRVNPISAVAPGILRKFFEFPSSGQAERFNDLSIR